jgi:opacity protein-like surface antigen
MRCFRCLLLLGLIAFALSATAQVPPESPYYSRRNSFGFFGAYSNDSSPILLGIAENRRLLEFGASWSRRLWQGRVVNWQYNVEVLPVALESDPLVHDVTVYTSPTSYTFTDSYAPVGACHSGSGSFTQTLNGITYAYTYTDTCARQWTIGEAMSPVGMQWNFLPRRKLQPVLIGHGGYMYSTQPIPTSTAGSFNFTFDFGAGFELYRTRTRSIRAEYRYHHISNHDTANFNPGIDNGLLQVTYSFGR